MNSLSAQIESAPVTAALAELQKSVPLLRRDYFDIARFTDKELLVNRSTASRAIRSQRTDWFTFAFLVHGKPPHEHMREHRFLAPGMEQDGLDKFGRLMDTVYFRRSRSILQALISEPSYGLISMWFSVLRPGAKIGLHINNDPYMYRAHIGVIVPSGNVGIKVGHERMTWKEGEMLAFDPTIPHTAWNLTEHERVVFIVDFFRPDGVQEQLRTLEREQFQRMMRHNPLSFGMSGGYYDLADEIIRQYAIPEIG